MLRYGRGIRGRRREGRGQVVAQAVYQEKLVAGVRDWAEYVDERREGGSERVSE